MRGIGLAACETKVIPQILSSLLLGDTFMFAAFLRVEWKPITDRYSEKTVVKVIPLADVASSSALNDHDIPDDVANALHSIDKSSVAFSSTAIVVGEWAVKTSIVNNTLPTD